MELAKIIGQYGLIPVVTINHADQAVPLARALLEGGLPCVEITFRTDAAEEAIRRIVAMYPGVVTGAGTVLSVGQAERAMGAGARFIVSPGFDPAVADWCLERNIPALPGVATPTEILMALGRGIDLVKFFPAEALGGVTMLEAVAAPFGNVRFVPTGGINAHNFPAYLRLKAVVACGGSWLASGAMLRSGNYAEITRLTREAVAIIGEAGAKGGHPRQEETAS